MTAAEIIAHLRSLRSAGNIAGMRRFGIMPRNEHLGISMPVLRAIARAHRRNHALALELWASDIHEARLCAALMDDPKLVTRGQMDRWVRDCDTWNLVDACAGHLFVKTPHALAKVRQWVPREAEFVRRAGFSLMAWLAVHAKEMKDAEFEELLPLIRGAATDERNFVKKAVNWALRQIGKRNPRLRRAAIAEAKRIAKLDSKAARWIARDALRELRAR